MYKKERGVALIIVIFILMVLAMLGAVLASLQTTQVQSAAEGLNAYRAFYIAEAGLLYIEEHEFRNDTDFSDNTSPTAAPFSSPYIEFGGGKFWVEYENLSSSEVDIKVTARAGDSVKVIWQHIMVDLPVVTDYVQMTSSNIHLNNASGNILGDLYAGGNIEAGSGVVVSGELTQSGSLQIPAMDWGYYKQKAQEMGTYVDGNVTFSSGTYGAEGDGNGIFYYVTGNVTINKNTTIYGTIIAEGNIKRSNKGDNISIYAQPLDIDGDSVYEDMPALATQGNLEFNNSSDITMQGLVYVDGNILLNNIDNFNFSGALVSDGNMNINNADEINLAYDSGFFDDMNGFEQYSGSVGLIASQWKQM